MAIVFILSLKLLKLQLLYIYENICRFVQRFRHQPPAPRGHREQKDDKEFWWLKHNAPNKNKVCSFYCLHKMFLQYTIFQSTN